MSNAINRLIARDPKVMLGDEGLDIVELAERSGLAIDWSADAGIGRTGESSLGAFVMKTASSGTHLGSVALTPMGGQWPSLLHLAMACGRADFVDTWIVDGKVSESDVRSVLDHPLTRISAGLLLAPDWRSPIGCTQRLMAEMGGESFWRPLVDGKSAESWGPIAPDAEPLKNLFFWLSREAPERLIGNNLSKSGHGTRLQVRIGDDPVRRAGSAFGALIGGWDFSEQQDFWSWAAATLPPDRIGAACGHLTMPLTEQALSRVMNRSGVVGLVLAADGWMSRCSTTDKKRSWSDISGRVLRQHSRMDWLTDDSKAESDGIDTGALAAILSQPLKNEPVQSALGGALGRNLARDPESWAAVLDQARGQDNVLWACFRTAWSEAMSGRRDGGAAWLALSRLGVSHQKSALGVLGDGRGGLSERSASVLSSVGERWRPIFLDSGVTECAWIANTKGDVSATLQKVTLTLHAAAGADGPRRKF